MQINEVDEFTTITITWDAADDEITQAAQAITFYAAHPVVRHDASELDDFRL